MFECCLHEEQRARRGGVAPGDHLRQAYAFCSADLLFSSAAGRCSARLCRRRPDARRSDCISRSASSRPPSRPVLREGSTEATEAEMNDSRAAIARAGGGGGRNCAQCTRRRSASSEPEACRRSAAAAGRVAWRWRVPKVGLRASALTDSRSAHDLHVNWQRNATRRDATRPQSRREQRSTRTSRYKSRSWPRRWR